MWLNLLLFKRFLNTRFSFVVELFKVHSNERITWLWYLGDLLSGFLLSGFLLKFLALNCTIPLIFSDNPITILVDVVKRKSSGWLFYRLFFLRCFRFLLLSRLFLRSLSLLFINFGSFFLFRSWIYLFFTFSFIFNLLYRFLYLLLLSYCLQLNLFFRLLLTLLFNNLCSLFLLNLFRCHLSLNLWLFFFFGLSLFLSGFFLSRLFNFFFSGLYLILFGLSRLILFFFRSFLRLYLS